MGLVSQECLLFQGTIEDNIRYGTESASLEEVVEAARAAYAHEFIMATPKVCKGARVGYVGCASCIQPGPKSVSGDIKEPLQQCYAANIAFA